MRSNGKSFLKHNFQKKKIVMLLANDFTHDSRVIKESSSAKEAGMKIWVICRKSKNTSFRENKDGIKIIRVQSFLDKIWSGYSKNSNEVAGSQSAGAPKSLVTYAALVNTWLINNLFIKEVLKIKPDIIHANDSTTLPAAHALKKIGFPVVYDAHELYSESLEKPNPIWKSFFVYYEKKLSRLDGIFSVNQSILNELAKRYQTNKLPQTILYNAPKYQKNKLVQHKTIKLLYLGHNMPGRGLEELFEAIKYIPSVTLSFYGNGFTGQHHPRILINKPVLPDKVVEETKKYDIGILPYIGTNLNHIYSTPNKLFEYMMAGLALAASDLPEIKKVVEKVQNGVLFNSKDPRDIASKIKGLIKTPKKIWQYKENSIKFAKEYSWEQQEKKQLELYSSVLCSRSLVQKPKVFLGPLDFGLNKVFKKEMEKHGFDVITCSFVEHGKYGWKNDIELKINEISWFNAASRVLRHFLESLHYDIYHFKFGQSLLPWNLDLPILKILGKKIVMNFHGLDIRQLDLFQKDFYNRLMVQKIGYSWFKEWKKRIRYHWIKNWVDKMVVSTPDLLEFVPEAEFVPEMAPIGKFSISNFQFSMKSKKQKSKQVILHAPSHRGIKGTEYVVRAVRKLQKEKYPVELLMAENIPTKKMGEYFQKADIIIDQLLIGAYGVVSIEGMLVSKPVICYIRNDLRKFYPQDLPILSANPENFKDVLEQLIKNNRSMNKIEQSSFDYIQKFHSPPVLGKRWAKVYNDLLQ